MHEFIARAAKVMSRYTAVALVLSMVASAAVAQTSQSQLRSAPQGALELLRQMQSGRSAGVGQDTLVSQLDSAREQGSQSQVLGGVDPRFLGRDAAQSLPSPIEVDYSDRSDEALTQFGYDLFSGGPSGAPLVGAVQDSYILGVGDDIVVTFRGQESDSYTVPVDREGRVVLPNLPPISAVGRSFGSFQSDLKRLTEQTFLGTEVFASVGSIRAVRVLVVGEVLYPGFKQVTSLSTALDALALAGGIKKTGSLRRVSLVRQGKSIAIDLYDLLLRGQLAHDLTLVEGDRIVVPSIGATVAVGGWVKRPGIFELPANGDAPALERVLGLAGGHLRPYGLRYIHLRPDISGKQTVVELVNLQDHAASDGDILLVNLREDVQIGDVSIDGHVRIQERRSLLQAPTLRDLLRDGSTIKSDPYLLFAAVETTDERTRARRYYPVSIDRILAGTENFFLRDNDRLLILSTEDVRFLRSNAVQAVLSGLTARGSLAGLQDLSQLQAASEEAQLFRASAAAGGEAIDTPDDVRRRQLNVLRPGGTNGPGGEAAACGSLNNLRSIVAASPPGRFSSAVTLSLTQDDVDQAGSPNACPEIFDENPDLLVFALDYVVSLDGEVREPGAYPIIPGTDSSALLATVGGATRHADLTNVEITRVIVDRSAGVSNLERRNVNLNSNASGATLLHPGDVIRFNQVFSDLEDGLVTIAGEFIRPGKYRIRRGETLSELIARAGSLTPQAYPYGAVFTRETAKIAEKAALERSVRDLQASLTTASNANASSDQAKIDTGDVSELIKSILSTEAVGRIVVEADPTVLQVRPDLDILMQPGDILIMPKRPSSVIVTGEVLSPGSQQFRSGSRPEDYLRFAGGTRPGADETRTFMVLPNGEAQPLDLAFWNYEPVMVPPGTTIIVPRDPAPFDLLTLAKDMTQLLSQISIVAASLAVISNN